VLSTASGVTADGRCSASRSGARHQWRRGVILNDSTAGSEVEPAHAARARDHPGQSQANPTCAQCIPACARSRKCRPWMREACTRGKPAWRLAKSGPVARCRGLRARHSGLRSGSTASRSGCGRADAQGKPGERDAIRLARKAFWLAREAFPLASGTFRSTPGPATLAREALRLAIGAFPGSGRRFARCGCIRPAGIDVLRRTIRDAMQGGTATGESAGCESRASRVRVAPGRRRRRARWRS